MISHTLRGVQWKPARKVVGGCAIISVLFTMAIGPCMPLITLMLALCECYRAACIIAAVIVLSMVLPVKESAWVCQFYLSAAGWFRHGVTMHIEDNVTEILEKGDGSMWCMHPHGTSIGFGFSLNGAVRFKAKMPAVYLAPEVRETCPPARLSKVSGVMAPMLFKIPLVRTLLLLFGCCTPASKEGMLGLMAQRSDFGILPGGMEEVALYQYRKERIYLRQRKGFIKYALQNGYLLIVAYTFGEADAYCNMQAGVSVRMWMQKNLGFIIPVFWGQHWWCPLLPYDDVELHTVVGSPIQLPVIKNPSVKDIEKWHEVYVDAIQGLFDRNKHSFGYGDRQLEIL